jgi:hypothetical protein
MATSGIGIDISGTLRIGRRTPAQGGSTYVSFGAPGDNGASPLIVDNSTLIPTVNIMGTPVTILSAEFYSLVSSNVVIGDGEDVPFAVNGPTASNLVTRESATIFEVPPGQYDVSWQLSALAACQTGIHCHAGVIATLTGNVDQSILGVGSATDQMTGRFMFRAAGNVGSPDAVQFSIRNYSGVDLTLVGNAGGAQAVASSLIVRYLGPALLIA